jgi:hypothetical protein
MRSSKDPGSLDVKVSMRTDLGRLPSQFPTGIVGIHFFLHWNIFAVHFPVARICIPSRGNGETPPTSPDWKHVVGLWRELDA